MISPWRIMTGGDWLVVLLLLGAALAGLTWLAGSPPGSRLVVTCGGQTCFVAALDQRQTASLDGPLGQTRLVIADGEVFISHSPCSRKTCIAMGPARHTGDLLACVPNRILVQIESPQQEEPPYDLLSR